MKDKRKLEVFSARLTRQEQEMWEEVCADRGKTKTGLLREWIRGAHKRKGKAA